MEDEQAKALRAVLLMAQRLKRIHPEVARLYRGGETYLTIGKYLSSQGVRGECLDKVVGYMIRGHEGGLDVEPYEGLIPDKDEREGIARVHHDVSLKKASLLGVSLRGDFPWATEVSPETGKDEEQYLLYLAKENRYKIKSGSNSGKIDWALLVEDLNRVYGNNRTVNAAKVRFQRKKKF